MFCFSKKFCRIFTVTIAIFLANGLFWGPFGVSGEEYTSTNFTVRDPVITIEGGRSTSASFEYFSSTGQTVIGESTSTNFTVRSGFLYFPEETPPPSPVGGAPPEPTPVFPSTITFSGKAYPQSEVVLLKDGQIASVATSGVDAVFAITLRGLRAGDYVFALYSRDFEGRRSNLVTLIRKIEQGTVTTVEGILIPPTIWADKTRVKKGDPLRMSGYSAPGAKVIISGTDGQSKFSFDTNADRIGRYAYTWDTSSLEFGTYEIFARALADGITSTASARLFFTVGITTEEAPSQGQLPCEGDLNGDCRVNLIDFSILVYWFGRSNPLSSVDFNGDSVIDLVDFSILAYWWTG